MIFNHISNIIMLSGKKQICLHLIYTLQRKNDMKTIYSTISSPVYPYTFLHPQDKSAFFDIETTGLSPNASSLYLAGLMRFDTARRQWTLCQWFADNYQSEKKIIQSFLDALSDVEYLYHFNGQTFDIPYLLKKCTRHAIVPSAQCKKLLEDKSSSHSIDLLKKIRPLRHALSLEKCKQSDLECYLGLKRTDIFSGADLISVYSEYMQKKILDPKNAEKLEQVLLLHNHDDIEMMLNLCSLLTYGEYLSEEETNRLICSETLKTMKIRQENRQLFVTLTLPDPVPKNISITACYPHPPSIEADIGSLLPNANLTFRDKTASFAFPLYCGTLKFFFPDYENYYYLPAEDTAVHKSVAEYVDRKHRKKATATTCYIKKESTFLPNLCTIKKAKQKTPENQYPLFCHQYKDKLSFYELTDGLISSHAFWADYIKNQLPYFKVKYPAAEQRGMT